MVGEDAHISRFSRNIYLNNILGIEEGLEFDKEFRGTRNELVEPCGEEPKRVLACRLYLHIHVALARRRTRVAQQRTKLVERTSCAGITYKLCRVLANFFPR